MIAITKLLCLLITFVASAESFTVVPQSRHFSLVQSSSLAAETRLFLQAQRDDDDATILVVPPRLVPRDNNNNKLLSRSSKVTVESTDAGSLQISIPEVGLLQSSSNLFDLGFTASWLGIIGYMTMGMVRASPVGALFTLPFWMAGASMANKSVIDPATSVRITIGVYGWSLDRTLLAGTKTTTTEGPTWQLKEALVDADMEVNGKPLTCVQLHTGPKIYSFGHALSTKEKDWVAMEINDWLEGNSDAISKASHLQ